nr:TetR/AcrR family transcriptional regulator [Ruegeria arenilitoris]
MKSAARVFAREGFDRASMTQLARECGISKANIYHYYDSKDAILFDILETYLRELRDLICGLEMDGLSPPEKLHRVVAEILLAYQGVDDEHRVQTSGMSALPEDQQRLLRGYQRDMVNFLSAILSEVAPDVFQGDGAKLRSATMSVFGMLNWYYMWNSGADAQARRDYAALVSNLTLSGVKAL